MAKDRHRELITRILYETSAEMVAAYRKVVDSGSPFAAELAENQIRPMIVNALPAYQIMSATDPIASQEDFAGRKVRVAGGAMTFTVNSLGGVPVEMPAGDMYVAMQRNTVDSTILALSSVKAYSVQELLKSMSGNGSFGTSAQTIAISSDAWDALSSEHQKVLAECGLKVEQDLARYLDEENEALKAEFAAAGIEVYELAPEAKAEIDATLEGVATDYIARLQERGLPGQEAYDEFRAALSQSQGL